jgi:hypothetical protein
MEKKRRRKSRRKKKERMKEQLEALYDFEEMEVDWESNLDGASKLLFGSETSDTESEEESSVEI